MAAFEYFFTLYGLVLGLSVVEVISGITRLIEDRKGVRIGWLTPLVAIWLLLDLTAFWTYAWLEFRQLEVNFITLLVGVAISACYYLAASVVFPKTMADWPDLDEHYLRRRRFLVCVGTLAGILLYDVGTMVLGHQSAAVWLRSWTDPSQAWIGYVYYACVITIFFSRNRWVNAAAILVIISRYAVLAALGAWA